MKRVNKGITSGIILQTFVVFICSYVIFLILWIQVKDRYGFAITYATSELVAVLKGVRFEKISQKKDIVEGTFSRPLPEKRSDVLVDIPVKTSAYTFNVPLTFSIMAALFRSIKRRGRVYVEALLILLGIHLLYVFSLQYNTLTKIFIDRGWDAFSTPHLFGSQFLWEFTHSMVIRFEPFLIGFYIFIRYRK